MNMHCCRMHICLQLALLHLTTAQISELQAALNTFNLKLYRFELLFIYIVGEFKITAWRLCDIYMKCIA
jgi:hypothetical protein